MKSVLVVALMSLAGCAFTQRHPVVTSIGASILVTSIALSGHHRSPAQPVADVTIQPVTCTGSCVR